ncbi:GNAT family N-acetyltransferase [Rubrobacter taiwanensis]|jgi:RimJ/RimL family protein N-acetyltransferase|nr:GNAT family protein [Rubrobacter taiwanensis]
MGNVQSARRPQVLFGESVELRRHSREHYPLYARWYGDREIWHLTSWTPEPMSPVAVERIFEERENSSLSDSFAIHLPGEPEPFGIVSFINLNRANASADLSILIGEPEYRGSGYGTDAIRTLLCYGFEELQLNRVGLTVFDFNHVAIRTYEKLGFRSEGRMRQAVRRNGAWHDAILMSLLRSEWERRESGG